MFLQIASVWRSGFYAVLLEDLRYVLRADYSHSDLHLVAVLAIDWSARPGQMVVIVRIGEVIPRAGVGILLCKPSKEPGQPQESVSVGQQKQFRHRIGAAALFLIAASLSQND